MQIAGLYTQRPDFLALFLIDGPSALEIAGS